MDGRTDDDAFDEAFDERELRVFLERAVPEPAAPRERMQQVRQRVLRRRRRRAGIAAAVTAVAGVTVLGALLRPAAGVQDAGPAASPTTDVPAKPTSDGLHRFDRFYGLTIVLPEGWHAARGVDERSQETEILSTRALPGGRWVCSSSPDGNDLCAPPIVLGDDDVLITFRQTSKFAHGDGPYTFDLVKSASPGKTCRGIGGTEELSGWGAAVRDAARPTINAFACMNRPTGQTYNLVRKLLSTAELDDH